MIRFLIETNNRDIRAYFCLTIIEYPQGRNGDQGTIHQDWWYTPGWPDYVTCDGMGGWEGDVELMITYNSPPMELWVLVWLEIQEEEDEWGNITHDNNNFWITYV